MSKYSEVIDHNEEELELALEKKFGTFKWPRVQNLARFSIFKPYVQQ